MYPTPQMPDFMDVVEPYLNRGDKDYLALILRHWSPAVDPEHHIGQALHEAIFRNDETAVRMILAAGANPKIQQPCDPGFTPLLAASQHGNLEIVRLFWQLVGPDGRFFPSKRPRLSCLAVAARNGHVDLVAYFLHAWDGWTDGEKHRALRDAASSWCDDVVALLLTENQYGLEAVQAALQNMMLGRQILPEAATRPSPKADEYLHQQRVVHLLIDAGASPNALTDRPMNEPLIHVASISRDGIGALTTLLEKGANADGQDSRGQTALHRLTKVKSPRADAMRVLLHYGASPDVTDEDGETPLYNVVRFGTLDQLKLCLSYSHDSGAVIRSTNCLGESLLHHAAAGDRKEFVEYLLNHGADVNSTTNNAFTPTDRTQSNRESMP